jgi:hypothetical protein
MPFDLMEYLHRPLRWLRGIINADNIFLLASRRLFFLVCLLTRFPGGIEGCPFTGVRSCERRCRFRETMG